MSEIEYAEGSCYLTVTGVRKGRNWWNLVNFKVTKNKPDLARDEVSMRIDLRLPSALFTKPTLGAKIDIEGDVPQLDLTPETVHSIESVIRAQSGLDVKLEVIQEE